jgi:hypothetical protein
MIKIVSRFDSTKVLKKIDAENLIGVDLIGADLSCANLIGADLSGADLSGANLICADLRSANLSDANLSDANLSDANLSCANLIGADLRGVNFRRADLRGANLRGAKYSLLSALRSLWDEVSSPLILEMIRWDALTCGVEEMSKWAKGGSCPFDKMEREFFFKEDRKLWKPGKPKMNHRQLWEALCKETGIKIDIINKK